MVPIIMLLGIQIFWLELFERIRGRHAFLCKVLLFISIGQHFKLWLLSINVESAVSK